MTPQKKLLLSSALHPSSTLLPQVTPRMGAIARKDITLIARGERSRVGDSLNFDAATAKECPGENRWDYLISVPDVPHILGIEPHSAKDDEVNVVIAKKRHAVAYLRDHFIPGHVVKKWFWISSGAVRFSNTEKKRRLLDQSGIEFVGRELRSLS